MRSAKVKVSAFKGGPSHTVTMELPETEAEVKQFATARCEGGIKAWNELAAASFVIGAQGGARNVEPFTAANVQKHLNEYKHGAKGAGGPKRAKKVSISKSAAKAKGLDAKGLAAYAELLRETQGVTVELVD